MQMQRSVAPSRLIGDGGKPNTPVAASLTHGVTEFWRSLRHRSRRRR